MNSSYEQALAYSSQEDGPEARAFAEECWRELGCEGLPPGVDYFLLDAGMQAGKVSAVSWLRLSVQMEPSGPPDQTVLGLSWLLSAREIIHAIEVLRRRRAKADPLWPSFSSAMSNRITRAKGRALKMVQVYA